MINIHAGQRVLYKHNGQWKVGELDALPATVNEKGVFFFIIPHEFIGKPKDEVAYVEDAEINNLYLDAKPVEDWMAEYNQLISMNDYIDIVNDEDFDKNAENAYVSDGEYYYYSINKFTEQWLKKQPFAYVVRF